MAANIGSALGLISQAEFLRISMEEWKLPVDSVVEHMVLVTGLQVKCYLAMPSDIIRTACVGKRCLKLLFALKDKVDSLGEVGALMRGGGISL